MSGASQVDRFLTKSPASRTEPKDLGFAAEAGASPRMIDLVMKNGDRIGLPYAYLVRVKLTGGETIELDFTEWTVKLTGRNLGVLYQHLLAQGCRRVEESPTGFDDDSQASWVEAIVSTKRT